MAPRITYNSVNIDLVQGKTRFQHIPMQERNQNNSASGKIETINQYGRFEYEFDSYFSQSVYYDLWAWWSWARQGKAWSFALDSANVGNTTLDAGAAAAQKDVPLTATAAFSAGDICLIRADDNDDEFELVEIDSVDAGVKIVTVDNLLYTYASGDIFTHKDYFASVLTTEKNFRPTLTGIADTTDRYYKHTFKFVENL